MTQHLGREFVISGGRRNGQRALQVMATSGYVELTRSLARAGRGPIAELADLYRQAIAAHLLWKQCPRHRFLQRRRLAAARDHLAGQSDEVRDRLAGVGAGPPLISLLEQDARR